MIRNCSKSALRLSVRRDCQRRLVPKSIASSGIVSDSVECFRGETFPSRRYFSDNLLGYSPMASKPDTAPANKNSKIPTAQDVSTSGGVWAPTSAKRDKITELRLALEEGQETLDDAATPEQKLDLDLADGLIAIVKTVDQGGRSQDLLLEEFDAWLEKNESELPEKLDRTQWEEYLQRVAQHAETLQYRRSTECLREVRDFYEWEQNDDDETLVKVNDLHPSGEAFDGCVLRFQFGLIQATADHLSKSWEELTTVTDADIDRAAVQDVELESQASTLSRDKLHAVLRAFATGTCADRVEAIWKLTDRDDDGLLDQVEMDRVAKLSLAPVQNSLEALFQDCIEAYPVRTELPVLDEEQEVESKPPGWRARRLEKKTQKRLLKIFAGALKYHFEDEVEMPHRLRCIYAWSEKAHQDNQTESVLVDSHGASSVLGAGRKRYVELEPKISHPEFLEVQQEHFSHLDRVGEEILKSFREDLLVDQDLHFPLAVNTFLERENYFKTVRSNQNRGEGVFQ